jgi:hypothetical protein
MWNCKLAKLLRADIAEARVKSLQKEKVALENAAMKHDSEMLELRNNFVRLEARCKAYELEFGDRSGVLMMREAELQRRSAAVSSGEASLIAKKATVESAAVALEVRKTHAEAQSSYAKEMIATAQQQSSDILQSAAAGAAAIGDTAASLMKYLQDSQSQATIEMARTVNNMLLKQEATWLSIQDHMSNSIANQFNEQQSKLQNYAVEQQREIRLERFKDRVRVMSSAWISDIHLVRSVLERNNHPDQQCIDATARLSAALLQLRDYMGNVWSDFGEQQQQEWLQRLQLVAAFVWDASWYINDKTNDGRIMSMLPTPDTLLNLATPVQDMERFDRQRFPALPIIADALVPTPTSPSTTSNALVLHNNGGYSSQNF